MKISHGWTLVGYMGATLSGLAYGDAMLAFIMLACCAWVDITSWLSAWKDYR